MAPISVDQLWLQVEGFECPGLGPDLLESTWKALRAPMRGESIVLPMTLWPRFAAWRPRSVVISTDGAKVTGILTDDFARRDVMAFRGAQLQHCVGETG